MSFLKVCALKKWTWEWPRGREEGEGSPGRKLGWPKFPEWEKVCISSWGCWQYGWQCEGCDEPGNGSSWRCSGNEGIWLKGVRVGKLRIDSIGRKQVILCVPRGGGSCLASCILDMRSTTELQLQSKNVHLSSKLGNHPHHTVMLEGWRGAQAADFKGRAGTQSDSCPN